MWDPLCFTPFGHQLWFNKELKFELLMRASSSFLPGTLPTSWRQLDVSFPPYPSVQLTHSDISSSTGIWGKLQTGTQGKLLCGTDTYDHLYHYSTNVCLFPAVTLWKDWRQLVLLNILVLHCIAVHSCVCYVMQTFSKSFHKENCLRCWADIGFITVLRPIWMLLENPGSVNAISDPQSDW